jgi:hypothetical protein
LILRKLDPQNPADFVPNHQAGGLAIKADCDPRQIPPGSFMAALGPDEMGDLLIHSRHKNAVAGSQWLPLDALYREAALRSISVLDLHRGFRPEVFDIVLGNATVIAVVDDGAPNATGPDGWPPLDRLFEWTGHVVLYAGDEHADMWNVIGSANTKMAVIRTSPEKLADWQHAALSWRTLTIV